ncbi:MAG: hypothetical protein M0Z71_13080 [Nitrospiraceae bacterium]|nr:hypothetical protein [Nitrospiraceae bacterium]
MKLSSHIAQGICLGPVAYYLTDLRTALVFSASVVLIDIDHYFHYIYRKKNLSISGMFAFYDEVWERRESVFGISVFHTVEVILLLVAAGQWYPMLRVVVAGFLVHMLFDFLHLLWYKAPFVRALSITEYFIRKKNYSPEMIW